MQGFQTSPHFLINVSCFSALTVRGITQTQGPWEVQAGVLIGIEKKGPQTWTDGQCVPQKITTVIKLKKKKENEKKPKQGSDVFTGAVF